MKTIVTRVLSSCLLLTVACCCSFAQPESKERVVEIPFDFYRNEIILQVKVNEKGSFNMMLDTGTDPSAIDLTTAKELGLKLHPLGKPASGGGTDANLTYYTELPLVEFGGFTVKKVVALAVDLSKISERLGKPLSVREWQESGCQFRHRLERNFQPNASRSFLLGTRRGSQPGAG